MFFGKTKLVTIGLVALLSSAAAYANQSGTRTGPYLADYEEAQAAARQGAEGSCSSYGGLQSYRQIGVVQNAGYYGVRYTYVCNS